MRKIDKAMEIIKEKGGYVTDDGCIRDCSCYDYQDIISNLCPEHFGLPDAKSCNNCSCVKCWNEEIKEVGDEISKESYKMRMLDLPKEPYFKVSWLGDINDGDYIPTYDKFTEKEFEEYFPYIVALLKLESTKGGFRELWRDLAECGYNEEEIEALEDMTEIFDVPSDTQENCHTVSSVDIKFYDTAGRKYQVYDIDMSVKPKIDTVEFKEDEEGE